MTRRRNPVRQTLLALIGVLALLVQGGLSSGAMAAPAFRFVTMCTEHGNEKLAIPLAPADPKDAPCGHCDHCVAPALAVIPEVHTTGVAVYAVTAQLQSAPMAAPPPAATGPPRPPGQAPPQS